MNSKQNNGLERLALRRSPSILAGLLMVQFAQAAPEDLTLPCPGALTHTFEVEDGGTLNADVVSDAGDSVFWSVTLGTGVLGGMAFDCTQSPPDPAAIESFSCPNGVSVSLPAGAPDSAVGPANPVLVEATPASGVGYASFALTATLEADPLQTCTRNFEVDVVAAAEPFDLTWVLDRSGSMGGGSDVIGGVSTRWEALEEGAKLILPFVAEIGGDAPGSNFGITLFAGSVLTDPLGGMIPIDGSFIPTVETALNQAPSGSTAMGSGLQDAMSKMTDATRPRIIMLFTDGVQNRNPRVAIDGCGFTNPASPINPPDCPATSGYKIVTVGIGNPSGDYKTTLEQLAANNRGKALVTNNGETFGGPDGLGNIVETFEASVEPVFSGLSPQQVAAYQGGFAAPVTLEGFDVNRKVDDVMLSVSLNRRLERPDLLRVLGGITIERDGMDVTSLFEPVVVGNFTSTAVLRAGFDDAESNPVGHYVVSLAPPPRMQDIQFRLAAFVDDHRLVVTSNVSPTVRRVNQPIEIQVELAWLTTAIEGANVEVSVLGPETDLGQALSDDPTVVDPSSGPDAGSPGQQKYDQLVANEPTFLEQLQLAGNTVPMSDEGGGVYRGSFIPSDVSDIYQVLYNVRASDSLFGDIQRRWVESIYVRFGAIDMEASDPTVQIIGNQVVLDFFPVRQEGLALGPGQGSAFAVSGMELVGVEDHQTGRYTLTLEGGDPGAPADTPIEVTLLGDPVYAGSAADFGVAAGGWLDRLMTLWWLWLILLLLLILAIVLVLRRAAGTP